MNQQNINTVQDILDALEQNPELQQALHKHLVKTIQTDDELRQELRKEILTEELLQLPERFADLVRVATQLSANFEAFAQETNQRLTNLESDVAELKGDVAELKTGVQRLEDRQNTMSGQVTTMSGQIANLSGNDYESKAIEQSRRLIRRHLNMVKATVIHASRWESQTFEENLLLPAIENLTITRQQADQLEDADSIIRCEDQDGNVVHVVTEISITVQDQDRRRAAERAEILAAATGTTALPFVVGQEQEPPGAGTPNVPFLTYPGERRRHTARGGQGNKAETVPSGAVFASAVHISSHKDA